MFHEGSDSTIATDYFTEMCGVTGQPTGRSNWPFITNYGDFTMMSDWSYLMTSFTVQVSEISYLLILYSLIFGFKNSMYILSLRTLLFRRCIQILGTRIQFTQNGAKPTNYISQKNQEWITLDLQLHGALMFLARFLTQIIDDFKLIFTIKVFGTGAGASPDGYYVEHMNKPNSHHIFSAPNMAGFLDVNQIKDEVNSNLQWMYDNGIYYVKVKYL